MLKVRTTKDIAHLKLLIESSKIRDIFLLDKQNMCRELAEIYLTELRPYNIQHVINMLRYITCLLDPRTIQLLHITTHDLRVIRAKIYKPWKVVITTPMYDVIIRSGVLTKIMTKAEVEISSNEIRIIVPTL